MKKFLALAMFALLVNCVKAQTSKGNMMIGGNFSFGSTSYEGSPDKYNTFTFAPSFGYFVSDNLAVGSGISFSQNSNTSGITKNDNTSFGLTPFVRYYKFTSNDRFAFFGQGTLGFGTYRNENGTSVSKGTTMSFSVAPGFSYFFNTHWAMDMSLSGLGISSSNPNGTGNNGTSFGLSLSMNPSIGLRYHFGK
jgi:outer membrane protein